MADTPLPDDERWMALALTLGRRGQGTCWPNPAVGCVIVAGGRVVGRGWTRPGGRPHAETEALAQAGAAARGATAYVTLEPCAHHGKTPPCADALTKAGIARVVTALEDLDPRVSGGGHTILRMAGIQVTTGILETQARIDHAGFLSKVMRGRPAVTLKLAMSLDGRIATAQGESQWITGPEARRLGHALRARHDAVLIGAGTARADDPTLTVRDLGVAQQPVRVVASRDLDLPFPSKLTQSQDHAPLWLLHGPGVSAARARQFAESGAQLMPVASEGEALDVFAMLSVLGQAGLTRVYCEGGGQLAAALLKAGVVDALAIFTAGTTLGAEGRPGVAGLDLVHLADAPRFSLVEQRPVGADLFSYWVRGA